MAYMPVSVSLSICCLSLHSVHAYDIIYLSLSMIRQPDIKIFPIIMFVPHKSRFVICRPMLLWYRLIWSYAGNAVIGRSCSMIRVWNSLCISNSILAGIWYNFIIVTMVKRWLKITWFLRNRCHRVALYKFNLMKYAYSKLIGCFHFLGNSAVPIIS